MTDRLPHFAGDGYRDTDGILRVVREGLCHRCGACVGFCPVNTYDTRGGYPHPARECIHCNICVRVCSGLEVDYPEIGRALYGEGYQFGAIAGPVRSAWIAHATDETLRRNGSSGGVVTAALIHWLRTGRIRGAVVTDGDPEEPARGIGTVARTEEDLRRTQQSRYTTAPTLAALQQIQNEDGPFAAVGLPCQIHAIRKRQLMDPRWGPRLPILIGLLCHYNLPWEAIRLAAETFAPRGAKPVRIRSRERDERGWPHNTLHIWYDNGAQWRTALSPRGIFNVVSRIAPIGRCLLCLDAAAEFSDFAVGDPWIRGPDGRWKYEAPEGYSAVLIHTAHGERLWRELMEEGAIRAFEIPAHEPAEGQAAMMTEKKYRVAWRLRMRRRLGWPVPRYPMPLPPTPPAQVWKELTFLLTRLNTLWPPWQRLLLRIACGPVGLWLVRWRDARRERAAQRRAREAAEAGT
ncbi:MAG: Coenzyme F420 hydrogenase/dehydrogenase, beta subunit C-terminal domain [Kiritimatiellae bacterium]|nr:Coenzyme F420 hydrogenase/dehydrogenase, beta subunit C-terminal domain [Kiritimatiellia bacterium]